MKISLSVKLSKLQRSALQSSRGLVVVIPCKNVEEYLQCSDFALPGLFGIKVTIGLCHLGKELPLRKRTLMRRDTERHDKRLTGDIEGHFRDNYLLPAYPSLKKLRSKFSFQVSAILKVGDCLHRRADP